MCANYLPGKPRLAAPLPLIILRPEPGAQATWVRAEAAGMTAELVPLFGAGPMDWTVPDPAPFDGLLLTSANALRFAGKGLAALSALPAWCVGAATAEAARAGGLDVRHIGTSDAQAVLSVAAEQGVRHLLWLAGEARSALTPPPGLTISLRIIYHASALPVATEALRGPAVVLIHSKRAARRLAALAPDRAALSVVAMSTAVAEAAGPGWRAVAVAPQPDDGEMVAMAAKLCHDGI